MRRSLAPLAAAFLLGTLPSLSNAGPNPVGPPSDLFLEWLSGWTVPAVSNGMRFDVDDGTRVPRLKNALLPREDRSVVVRRPDGSTVVYPDPILFGELTVIRIENGKPLLDCVSPAEVVAVPTPRPALPVE